MAVGILEVDAAAAPMMVDLSRLVLVRIGPIGDPRALDAAEA
jgi:hypothetical protein